MWGDGLSVAVIPRPFPELKMAKPNFDFRYPGVACRSGAHEKPVRRAISFGDKAFFALHPDRRFRARKPSRSELKSIRKSGTLPNLKTGQELVVIVTRIAENSFSTSLYSAWLDRPGHIPNTDSEIRAAFLKTKPESSKG